MIRLLITYSMALGLLILSLTGCGRERLWDNSEEYTNEEYTAATPTPTPNPYRSNPTPTPTPVAVNFSLPALPNLPGTTFAPILSVAATAYAGHVDADWCRTWGDQLTKAEGLGRLAWAKKYYGEWSTYYMIAESVANKLYPSFGRVDETNKPYNPLAYKAPKVENGPRNLPEGYMLVALCAPTL